MFKKTYTVYVLTFCFLSQQLLFSAVSDVCFLQECSGGVSEETKEKMFVGLWHTCKINDFGLFSIITSYPIWRDIFRDYQFGSDKVTLLHIALSFGVTSDFVRHLVITLQCPLNIPSWNGWTPLHAAAFANDVESFDILLSAGATLSVYDMNGLTPYGVALEYECKEIIQYYFDKNLCQEKQSVLIPEKTEEQIRKIEEFQKLQNIKK